MRLIALSFFLLAGLCAGEARSDLVADCQQQDQRALAIAACSKAIADAPSQDHTIAWAYNNRGLAQAGLGDALRAIDDFTKAIALDPDYAPAFSNRGNVHAALGDLLPALADHTRALALQPGDIAARHNRGVDHEQLGQHRKALDDYHAVIRMAPRHRGAHIGLATAACKLGRIKASVTARLAAIEKGLIDPVAMQTLLQAEGFYAGAIDGKFGKRSRAALRAWTRKGCLPVR